MTYEQFLKQLRRIGRQIMFLSFALAIFSLLINLPVDLMRWAEDELSRYLVLGLIGLCIYPQKSEE